MRRQFRLGGSRRRPLRERGRGRGKRRRGESVSVIFQVEDAGAADRVRGGGALPVEGVEHDGGAADPARKLGSSGVLRVPQRAPPRPLLAGAPLLRR